VKSIYIYIIYYITHIYIPTYRSKTFHKDLVKSFYKLIKINTLLFTNFSQGFVKRVNARYRQQIRNCVKKNKKKGEKNDKFRNC